MLNETVLFPGNEPGVAVKVVKPLMVHEVASAVSRFAIGEAIARTASGARRRIEECILTCGWRYVSSVVCLYGGVVRRLGCYNLTESR